MTSLDLSKIELWDWLKVELRLETELVGGIPSNSNMIEGWLKSKNLAHNEEELEKLKQATLAELPNRIDQQASGQWTTFKIDKQKGGQLYIEGRQVKAAFKEAANVLRELLQEEEKRAASATAKATKKGKAAKDESPEEDEGEKKKPQATKSMFTALRARVAERLFVVEDKIHLFRDGKPITEPDGSPERPIHVMTAQGPRTSIKRTDVVNPGSTLSFTVRILRHSVVETELVKVFLNYMQVNGIGADRSQGKGTFTVTHVEQIKS